MSPFVSGGAQLQTTPGNGIPGKLRIGEGIFGVGIVSWTTGSLAWRRGLPVKSAGSSGRACSCTVPCARPRLRAGGEMAFLYDVPTVMPWGFDPFAGTAGVPLVDPVELANCDAGPDMWLTFRAADCVDVRERLFPARAIAARNSAANSAPAIVFRLGARITDFPFHLSGRIRFVLLPSILLGRRKGTVARCSIRHVADGGQPWSCRARKVGRARPRAGVGHGKETQAPASIAVSHVLPNVSPLDVRHSLPDTKAARFSDTRRKATMDPPIRF